MLLHSEIYVSIISFKSLKMKETDLLYEVKHCDYSKIFQFVTTAIINIIEF